MSERARDIIIGLASIAAILATAFLLLSFGAFRGIMQPRYDVTVLLDRAGGLRFGSQVTLDGVPIGLIDDVTLDMSKVRPVRLVCAVDEWARIPVNHEITVESGIIGGGSTLAFKSIGEANNRPVFELDELPEFIGNYMDMGQMISGALDQRMAPIVESFDSFTRLADTYNEVGMRMNGLLDTDVDSEGNITTAILRVNEVLEDAQNALQLAGDWLGDQQMKEDARTAVFKANLLIERATETIGKAGELADALQVESAEVGASLVSTADSIDQTLIDVRGLLAKATDGPGTLSRLLGDETLYEDLQDSVRRLESTLSSIQALINAVEEEGVSIDF